MPLKYNKDRPSVPAAARRQAEIEAGHMCSIAHCNERISLELHHIDGNRENNRVDNLIILCAIHHSQADKGDIDRKALREYKRFNRERLGVKDSFQISPNDREKYLLQFMSWLEQELLRHESSPLAANTERFHVQPSLKPYKIAKDISESNNTNTPLDSFVKQYRHMVLLGSGGSGKTTAVLDWLLTQSRSALENDDIPIPTYVPLTMLTPHTGIAALTSSPPDRICRTGISENRLVLPDKTTLANY